MGRRSKEHRILRARLLRFFVTRRRRELLSPKAECQARDLAAKIDPERDVGDAFILGMFHWTRYLALPSGQDQEDFAAAARFLAPVYGKDPRRVPADMRRHLERYERWNQPPGDGPVERRSRVLAAAAAYRHGGSTRLLKETAELLRAAVAGIPEGEPDRAGFLSDLGAALRCHAEATGDGGDLADAIGAHRAAIAAAVPGDPDRTIYGYNLAVALTSAYERSGDSRQLDEAIGLFRAAVVAVAPDDPHRGAVLAGLGSALAWRAERFQLDDELEEAVRVHRAAVAATADGDAELAGRQSNLGSALQALFHRHEDIALLEEAVRALRSAEAASRGGHSDRAGHLANLAAGLVQLAEQAGRSTAMDEAIRIGREAVAATPGPDPRRAEYLFNLGYMLRSQGKKARDSGLLAEAARCQAEASENIAARARVRISAYQQLAHLATDRQQAADALKAMEAAVAILPQTIPGFLARADREFQLGVMAGIAGDAAAAALGAGRPGRAVELLEQSRGILLADALKARSSDLAVVAESAPGLVHDLQEARTVQPDADDAVEQVINQIRGGGWPGFLSVPRLDQLAAGINGPVVFLFAGLGRCDAIIVRPGGSPTAKAVPLPGLTQDEAYQQTSKFAYAQVVATADDAPAGERARAQAEMLAVLGWIWDAITEPVLDALGYTTIPATPSQWPRVWWCPVGVLAYLPLHAAGHHQDTATADAGPATHHRSAMDRVISSYAITLRSLAYASAGPSSQATQPALVVSVPNAPGQHPLPEADDEAREVAAILSGAHVLAGSDAVHGKVLAALPAHAIAHFTCHGFANMTDPGSSQLSLTDYRSRPLTVSDISELKLSGRLAYLSACETGRTTPELADEAVHITGAFHLAGYQHVIGTLWPVYDATARALAVDFYQGLTRQRSEPPDPAHAAQCLHHAVRSLRDRRPHSPLHWAPYTHTGP